jgi:hypothetical protein
MPKNVKLVRIPGRGYKPSGTLTEVRTLEGGLLGLMEHPRGRGWLAWIPGQMMTSIDEKKNRQEAIDYLLSMN